MEEIIISNKIWDLASDYIKKNFPEEKIDRQFWCEDRVPNMQGLLGELGFVDWLGMMPIEKYMDNRAIFRRTKGIDLIIGNTKVDIKTPSLKVPPKKYHRFLFEKALIDKNITDIFVCQFLMRPEMKQLFLMGYVTADDVISFGELRRKGENIYGDIKAGYDGYLIASEYLNPPEKLKDLFADQNIGDTLMALR